MRIKKPLQQARTNHYQRGVFEIELCQAQRLGIYKRYCLVLVYTCDHLVRNSGMDFH